MTPHGASQKPITAETVARALGCEAPGCSCGKQEGNRFKIRCPAHQDFSLPKMPAACLMILRAGTEGPWVWKER